MASDYDGKIVEHKNGYSIVDGWNIDFAGSAMVGYLKNVTYDQIVKELGQPVHVNGVHIEYRWHVKFDDGKVATIFNYKGEGKLENLTVWAVGGFKDEVVKRVEGIFNENDR